MESSQAITAVQKAPEALKGSQWLQAGIATPAAAPLAATPSAGRGASASGCAGGGDTAHTKHHMAHVPTAKHARKIGPGKKRSAECHAWPTRTVLICLPQPWMLLRPQSHRICNGNDRGGPWPPGPSPSAAFLAALHGLQQWQSRTHPRGWGWDWGGGWQHPANLH